VREAERGSFSIPREWTDWAVPSAYDVLELPLRRFDFDSLLELVNLLDQIGNRLPKGVDK